MSDGLSTETHDDCLDITELFVYDESIQSLQYFEFTPQTFANCNTVGHPIKFTSKHKMRTTFLQRFMSILRDSCVETTTIILTQQLLIKLL